MSANTGDESIFTKFKNLVLYKINNAVSDPKAEKYAAEIAKNKEEKEEQFAPQINTTVDIITADTTKFNIKRLLNKILDQTIDFLKKAFFPFVALMLAMIVANEMIVYTAPVRIIFFIFTFLVCFFAPSLCTILGIFYILKGAYSYYINNMTGKLPSEKLKIMPTIYALLPITTYTPESSLGKFFYYPFRYPKSAISEAGLPKIMDAYLKTLIESFKDFDSVKNEPIFSNQLKELEGKFEKLHEKTQINPIFKLATSKPKTTEIGATTVPVIAATTVPVIAATTVPVIAPVKPAQKSPISKSLIPKFSLTKLSLPKAQITPKIPPPSQHNEIVAALTPKEPLAKVEPSSTYNAVAAGV
jgi:hypothetical protein